MAARSLPHAAPIRLGLGIASIALLILGIGILIGAPWARATWPVQEGPLSYRFIGSILLAQAIALGWTAITLELNYARGGTIGFAAMNAGMLIFALTRIQDPALRMGWIVVNSAMLLGGLALFVLGARYPQQDTRPVPGLVRWSFLILSLALTAATVMLLARAPVVFPWKLSPDTSVLFGLFYFASITYFIDGWRRAGMGNALGQLAAFFVYDIVLIPRYLAHWEKAQGGFKISLMVYLAVLFWSAGLAVWIWTRELLGRNRSN